MAAGFSRLQLAAALLEYDNDPDNPDAPHRSAHESAIFAHLRRNAGTPAHVVSRRSDYLAVSLPSEGGSLGGRESVLDNRRSRTSRGSIDALRNPFGADDNFEDEDVGEGDELEVDLASWGLDAFMPKDKLSKNGKGKAKSAPHPVSSVPSHQPLTNNDTIVTVPRRALGASRSLSVGGNLEYFGAANIASSSLASGNRRRSIGSPLDLVGMEPPQMPMHRRRASSYTMMENRNRSSQSVPFPIASPLQPAGETGFRTSSGSRFDPNARTHERTQSSASMGSRVLMREHEQVQADRPRSMSNTTMPTVLLADDNPFALRPPSRASRFDPKAAAHARTSSNVSMGSRMLRDVDGVSDMTGQVINDRERHYSTTLELLRPKVLVMPSPLQPVTAPAPPPSDKVRDGFQLSTDGPPLPPGARSARPSSTTLSLLEPSASVSPPIASNSFTPNPLMNLSLSQQTFRNTLMVGGQTGPIHTDLVPRATQDGEQIHLDLSEPEADFQTPRPLGMDDPSKTSRPAGKLYGKSLIDDLENRKAQMRSKQRVFTGDQRPSMMARNQQQRSSTLIDPAALHARPVPQRVSSYGSQTLGRRNSANAKPLLNFDDDHKDAHKDISSRLPSNRSVFGVDTLWEREMVKLREIETQERLEAEERRKREQEENKQDKKKKRKGRSEGDDSGAAPSAVETTSQPRVTLKPPVLPDIERAAQKKPRPVQEDESESDDSEFAGPSGTQTHDTDPGWISGSSDGEDDGPRRTTGVGLRYPSKARGHVELTGDDSDDDLPLSTTVSRVIRQTAHHRQVHGESDDEEKPLSTLLQKKQSLPRIDFNNLLASQPVEDDDNQPLGLRVSRVAPSLHGRGHAAAVDDDDRPLAYHPEQQRRTQYQMLAQQQQFMMQAQLQNSMFFSPPPMMGPAFFNPTMVPPMMMQPPVPIPSPPPIHDEAKYGRVNKWRYDVAVEGET